MMAKHPLDSLCISIPIMALKGENKSFFERSIQANHFEPTESSKSDFCQFGPLGALLAQESWAIMGGHFGSYWALLGQNWGNPALPTGLTPQPRHPETRSMPL